MVLGSIVKSLYCKRIHTPCYCSFRESCKTSVLQKNTYPMLLRLGKQGRGPSIIQSCTVRLKIQNFKGQVCAFVTKFCKSHWCTAQLALDTYLYFSRGVVVRPGGALWVSYNKDFHKQIKSINTEILFWDYVQPSKVSARVRNLGGTYNN